MGAIVDKTKSKHGKARCWILWLCIPNAIAAILLFALQGSWPDVVKYVYVFITYNLVNTIFFTGLIVPYNAMNALMTKNQYERGMLGTVNVIGAVVGQILVNSFMLKIVGFFGNTQSAWIITTSIFAIIGAALHLFCFFGTKERTSEAAKKREDEPGFVESIKSLLHNKYWLLLTVIGVSRLFGNRQREM